MFATLLTQSSSRWRAPRRRLAAALAGAFLAVAACDGSSDSLLTGVTTGGGATSLAGTYTLTGAADVASPSAFLPASSIVYQSGGSTYALSGGTLTLGTDSTFTLTVVGTQATGTGPAVSATIASLAGVYRQSGAALTFTPSLLSSIAFPGTVVGSTVVVTAPLAGGPSYLLQFTRTR